MANSELHVVFGAGQIGPLVAERLLSMGKQVRIVRRSDAPVLVQGAELLRGDAMDPAFCEEAARGAAVLYHCMNTAYFARVWQETLPRIQRNLLAAAGKAGARLVVLDNVYALGRPGGQKLSEATPANPCARKGEIRARLAEELWSEARKGGIPVSVGRASDFYGPGGEQSQFGSFFWPRVLKGKSGQVIVNPATPHSYHFTRDVAAGLVALGTDAESAGNTFMLPVAPAVSTAQMVELFAKNLGRPIPLQRMPPLLLAAIGLFWPMGRELKEMGYQWAEPFVVDDSRFRARYPSLAPTSLEEGARQTVEWAQKAFAQA